MQSQGALAHLESATSHPTMCICWPNWEAAVALNPNVLVLEKQSFLPPPPPRRVSGWTVLNITCCHFIVGCVNLFCVFLVSPPSPPGQNYCAADNGGCSHLCLATPNGRSCKCPDNAASVGCVERGQWAGDEGGDGGEERQRERGREREGDRDTEREGDRDREREGSGEV